MNEPKIVLNEYDASAVKILTEKLGVHSLTAKLLSSRGINTVEAAREFIDKDKIELLDPFLMKDMDKAVSRIRAAIEKRESVCIYGDYDVDGVTATTLIYTYLCEKGCPCSYFIPDRISEGYGLSAPVIKRLSENTDLIITVDTGITAVKEVEYAKELGVDMIITDHHNCRFPLPDATAVVNPHREDDEYPFKQLAGVGVVFKLLCALEGDAKAVCDRYAEIVAIGTIADVMPIIGENRYIAHIGLGKLTTTPYKGLIALMEQSGVFKNGRHKKMLSSTVGYVLAPRINAAGRIASASKAVELLLADNDEDANRIAAELCDINKLRQTTEQEIYSQALEQMKTESESGRMNSFIVLCSDGWHQGVIGVVASRISEKYGVPCVLFSFDGDIGKGSGRSVKGLSLMDALASCEDLLIEFGGHELAAGLSIKRENVAEFTRRINEYAASHPSTDAGVRVINADCEVLLSELTVDSINELQLLEPFGLQNPLPVFVARNLYIADVTPLSGGKHVRLKLRSTDSVRRTPDITALFFGVPFDSFRFYRGDICDVVFSADINEYMGMTTPQLLLKSVDYGGKMYAERDEGEKIYAALTDPDNHRPVPTGFIPTLAEFCSVFRFLRRQASVGEVKYTVMTLCRAVAAREERSPKYCALKIILDVLEDEDLITVKKYDDELFSILLNPVRKKVDLDTTRILASIRANHTIIRDTQ